MIDSKGVRAKYQLEDGATEMLSIIPWTLAGEDMALDRKRAIAPEDKPPNVLPNENGDV
jgi:hypothetical protein